MSKKHVQKSEMAEIYCGAAAQYNLLLSGSCKNMWKAAWSHQANMIWHKGKTALFAFGS